MQFALTDNEAVEFLRTSIRRDDGMLLIDIPDSHLASANTSRPHLSFAKNSRTVHHGSQSARLWNKEFGLLQYIYEHGRTSFEEAQDAVWHRNVSDATIRKTCSRLSTRLLDADIPLAVLTRNGGILIEEVLS